MGILNQLIPMGPLKRIDPIYIPPEFLVSPNTCSSGITPVEDGEINH
jgi:hypothetical protein